ncbi:MULTISPECIES: ferritin-like domain-containing protein [unclassified Rhizobium]|jgi:ferritin-like metal-binding protein YciE|uniref:YciE/YciF ferroxidase family protein n=1 Tax=unclassified Rhizobium TaxID=2613769 RepID=UPI00160A960D|nr:MULTISPECIES: ferritin-like domain-containing protein [unclassified Rhizobium]MBB3542528.1 ferritin-like metal-binding protein YciE [Rhizobium sp. BK399]MCS3738363.1 ferritin-like metal-binding protein YciE [Rhizobium sp. BK661]MCS4093203.1 ferritin-like metal-binding protein YciE [Rhizobium sp. BK176]
MAKEKTLDDLFYDTLKDIYFAERQILRALPKMARAARSQQLKAGFEKHREQTEGHVERLQQVFEIVGKRAQGKTCEAIQGIIAEGEEIIDEFKGSPAIDAGLISAAQAVEHYEIARYGTLKTWAQTLGKKDVVALLDATLKEEAATDKTLSQLAMTAANQKAAA